MAPLLLELSSLEVGQVKAIISASGSEKDSSLTTLSTSEGDLDVLTVLTGKGAFSPNLSI